MTDYTPPIADMIFALEELHGFQSPKIDSGMIAAILDEAAKLASDVLAPLNWVGDQNGAQWKDGVVTTAPGFKDAYAAYRDGGWNAVPFDEDYGGQGLPWAIGFPIQEMWQSANMAFGLCPLLNQAAVEAIAVHGSKEQKDLYLAKLISGEWTGTMNLTEPHAGSDLGLLRAKAERAGDGTFRLKGQKIWITYGEHDLADNIINMVLARIPDAPDDVKGLSLFVVPKFLPDGTRNDFQCVGLDHKLGIHASPTCVMQYGEKDGAVAYLLGQENEGLKGMFTMMNNARLSVGLQGVAIAERAYQAATAYAAQRVQGRSFSTGERVTIDQHADVKRMLMMMRTLVEGARALTYEAAIALDGALAGDVQAQEKADLLTPVVKAWCTDIAQDVAGLCIQVHGGMGFIEETKVAQYYRDARILTIYEGTNGIQGADLVFRKILRDQGKASLLYLAGLETKIRTSDRDVFAPYFEGIRQAQAHIVKLGSEKNMDAVAALAVPFGKAFGIIACAALMSRAAGLCEDKKSERFYAQKQKTARFYIKGILPQALGWLTIAMADPDL